MLLQAAVFGLSLSEAIIVGGVIAWIVAQFRDFRPIKSLREENRGLRHDLGKANERIQELEEKCERLERRTDLTVLQEEHKQIADTLERLVKHLDRLDHSVKANTAAVELVARQSAIGEALDEHDRKENVA